MPECYDAVIVGAGPAGLAAGIVLARSGLRVLIGDRHRLPIDKVCGEGVLPHGVRDLQRLDVLKNLDQREAYPFVGIRVQTPRGTSAAANFREGSGLGIRRLNLSRALLQTARNWRSLEIQDNVPIRPLRATPEGTEVWFGQRQIMARLLIGADGLNSWVRHWAGLDGGRQRLRRLAARQHFRIAPWSDHVEVYYGNGMEAYVTPCGRDIIGVAFLWDHARHRGLRGGPDLFSCLLCAFPDLERRLKDAVPASTVRATGPLHRVARGQFADGVILVGDAGGYLDACSGEGICLALAEAISLEKTVAPLLKQGWEKPSEMQLAGFGQACRQITRPYYQFTWLLLFLTRHPMLFERLIAAFQFHPEIMEHLWSTQIAGASLWPGCGKAVRLVKDLLFGRQQPLRQIGNSSCA